MTTRELDYVSRLHEDNLRYLVRDVQPKPDYSTSQHWTAGKLLDQGREGACVGFGWSGEASASPVRVKGITNGTASAFYRRCKEVDEYEGVDYDGTSVRAGALVAREHGWIGAFYWCKNIDDFIRAIRLGPVVIGVTWYEGMYETDDKGTVNVTGREVGGHCLYVTSYYAHAKEKSAGWINSWGDEYGKLNQRTGRRTGKGVITLDRLEALVFDQGNEMCVPVDRHLGAA